MPTARAVRGSAVSYTHLDVYKRQIHSYQFVKSVIRSRVKGVYKEINALLDGSNEMCIRDRNWKRQNKNNCERRHSMSHLQIIAELETVTEM